MCSSNLRLPVVGYLRLKTIINSAEKDFLTRVTHKLAKNQTKRANISNISHINTNMNMTLLVYTLCAVKRYLVISSITWSKVDWSRQFSNFEPPFSLLTTIKTLFAWKHIVLIFRGNKFSRSWDSRHNIQGLSFGKLTDLRVRIMTRHIAHCNDVAREKKTTSRVRWYRYAEKSRGRK